MNWKAIQKLVQARLLIDDVCDSLDVTVHGMDNIIDDLTQMTEELTNVISDLGGELY